MTMNRPSIRIAYTEAKAITERFSSAFMLTCAGLKKLGRQLLAASGALYQMRPG
ncbi:hypothetical protein MAALD49_07240 [Marinobacter shengliensis]|nr:hypothetical protein MAALD49_07240 [Marinobacter shengliensis]